MTKEYLLKRIKSEIFHKLFSEEEREHISIEEVEVVKSNDRALFGLSFIRDKEDSGSKTSPTYWINDFLDGEASEQDASGIAKAIYESYKELACSPFGIYEERVSQDVIAATGDYSLRLLEDSRNEKFFETALHRPAGCGMSFVPALNVITDDGIGSCFITKAFAESLEGEDAIFDKAFKDTEKTFPPVMFVMPEDIFGIADMSNSENLLESEEDLPTNLNYVVSNEAAYYGAAALFYPGVSKRIRERLGENFYAVPMSVHEFLLVPESNATENATPEALQRILREANRYVVEEENTLSDNLLFCNDGKIDIVKEV